MQAIPWEVGIHETYKCFGDVVVDVAATVLMLLPETEMKVRGKTSTISVEQYM